MKKDGIEYGGAVGAGADHRCFSRRARAARWPEPLSAPGVIYRASAGRAIRRRRWTTGSVLLLFTLTEPLNLVPAGTSGN
jgi:hypothetical protein